MVLRRAPSPSQALTLPFLAHEGVKPSAPSVHLSPRPQSVSMSKNHGFGKARALNGRPSHKNLLSPRGHGVEVQRLNESRRKLLQEIDNATFS